MFMQATMLLCAIAMALFIYKYDLYEKERWYMVVLAVVGGFGLMWLAGRAEDALFRALHIDSTQIAAKAALVTLLEDGAKLSLVLLFAVALKNHFNDPLDGLLYGTLGGLGAGVQESLMYLSLSPATAQTLGAEVVRLFAHAMMGGLVGFAVGLGARPDRRAALRPALILACAGTSAAVHFSWDYIAYQPRIPPGMRGVMMLLMFCLMMVWGWMVAYASRASRSVFVATPTGNTSPKPPSRFVAARVV